MKVPGFLESNSIQITISASFVIVVLVTVGFLGTSTLVLTREALWDTTTLYSDQLVDRVSRSIEAYLNEMAEITEVLLDEVQVLGSGGPDPVALQQTIQQTFSTVGRLRSDISLIGVVSPELGTRLHLEQPAINPVANPLEQDWYQRAVEAGGAPVYTGARIQNMLEGTYRWVVTVARARGDLVLFVDLTFRTIEDLVRSVELGARGYLFITDRLGSIVYHPQQQLIYSDLFQEPISELLEAGPRETVIRVDGEERLYLQSEVAPTGWWVVSVTAVEQLLASQRQVQSYYFAWIAVVFAVVMLLTYALSRRIAQPITRLRRSMQAVEQGRFDVQIPVDRADEIGALSRDFAIMVNTIQDLMKKSEQEQEDKRDAELRALQHQITPHFLYNTLDSIVWMAEGGRTGEVVSMTTNLARLLRLSIGSGDAMVSLRSELDYLRSYLAIQQMRYRDRLSYVIDADEAALEVRIPRLTLQPAVENAIYHGIKQRETGGEIRVECRCNADHVVVDVTDNGPGMDAETLQSLRSSSREPGSGVGLRNTHQRLALTYGDSYVFQLESRPGQGTRVRFCIPWRPVA